MGNSKKDDKKINNQSDLDASAIRSNPISKFFKSNFTPSYPSKLEEDEDKCEDCNGKGALVVLSVICPKCGGTGKIEKLTASEKLFSQIGGRPRRKKKNR